MSAVVLPQLQRRAEVGIPQADRFAAASAQRDINTGKVFWFWYVCVWLVLCLMCFVWYVIVWPVSCSTFWIGVCVLLATFLFGLFFVGRVFCLVRFCL